VRNIKLTLQYDGTNFSGYELQPGKRTIRSEIQKALFKLFKAHPKITNASRTDSGVHAVCQVVNFHIKSSIPTKRIAAALNSLLPEDIRVGEAQEKLKFHARYDVKNKEYEYLIFNGQILSPIYNKFVWQVKPRLNLSAMRKAARILQGRHDFFSFCASRSDDKNFVRNILIFFYINS